MAAAQYALKLALPAVFSEDNFFVSACNREAHQWVMRWPNWPGNALLLYGPAGCGKSHLGHIWAARAKAGVAGPALSPDDLSSPLLVEDIDRRRDERGLLHLLNYAGENACFLLFTSALPPKQLPFALPDLTSRLKALPAAAIAAPDDEALAAAMRKQFADRQIKIEAEAIEFLLPRIDRSFAHAAEIVAMLDHKALVEQRSLTIPFIKQALAL